MFNLIKEKLGLAAIGDKVSNLHDRLSNARNVYDPKIIRIENQIEGIRQSLEVLKNSLATCQTEGIQLQILQLESRRFEVRFEIDPYYMFAHNIDVEELKRIFIHNLQTMIRSKDENRKS